MKPMDFKQANKTYHKPEDMTEKECGSLRVYIDDNGYCISKWKMSFMDRLRCLFQGYVWLSEINGGTVHPVKIATDSPFV